MPYIENPEKVTLEYLKEILDVLGIIDSKGKYFIPNKSTHKLTQEKISELFSNFPNRSNKEDWSRTIKTAAKIFNSVSNDYQIKGNKNGTSIQCVKKEVIKLANDKGYETLLILFMAMAKLDGCINLDFLTQLQSHSNPLGLLTFLSYAIKTKWSIQIKYKSDREGKEIIISNFVPVKINLRDGHWFLIGWNPIDEWNQYLLHCILEIIPEYEIGGTDPKVNQKIPDFDIGEFYRHSFGIAVLKNREPIPISIQVPIENEKAVRKRRKEGVWFQEKEYWIWKVYTYNEDEVFEYVFRWNGILKIVSPKEVINRFQEKIKKFL